MRVPFASLLLLAAGAASSARADLEPGHVVNRKATAAQAQAARLASDAAQALGQGDFAGAVTISDRALASNGNDFFAHYVRAEALSRAGRLDEAVAEYRQAERDVPRGERWNRAIVLWGRANAFYQRGRCDESKSAFNEYIAFARSDDPRGTQLAQARIDGCRPPWVGTATTPATTPAAPATPTAPTPSTGPTTTPPPKSP